MGVLMPTQFLHAAATPAEAPMAGVVVQGAMDARQPVLRAVSSAALHWSRLGILASCTATKSAPVRWRYWCAAVQELGLTVSKAHNPVRLCSLDSV